MYTYFCNPANVSIGVEVSINVVASAALMRRIVRPSWRRNQLLPQSLLSPPQKLRLPECQQAPLRRPAQAPIRSREQVELTTQTRILIALGLAKSF